MSKTIKFTTERGDEVRMNMGDIHSVRAGMVFDKHQKATDIHPMDMVRVIVAVNEYQDEQRAVKEYKRKKQALKY